MSQEGTVLQEESSNGQTATHKGCATPTCRSRYQDDQRTNASRPSGSSSAGFAWTRVSESWVPVWITILQDSRSCTELIKCSCKGDCSNCTCGKTNPDCSPLCKSKCTPYNTKNGHITTGSNCDCYYNIKQHD